MRSYSAIGTGAGSIAALAANMRSATSNELKRRTAAKTLMGTALC